MFQRKVSEQKHWLSVSEREFRRYQLCKLLVKPLVNRLCASNTRACVYQGVRNVHFSENLTCFVFLKHLFWDSPFCLFYYQQFSRLPFFVKCSITYLWQKIGKIGQGQALRKSYQKVLIQNTLCDTDYTIWLLDRTFNTY